MELKKKEGHKLYNPLSYAFSMVPTGGSPSQTYNTIKQVYNPNRSITPFMEKPKLTVNDPDGVFSSGDYTTKLVNVKWTVKKFVNHVQQASPTGVVSNDKKITDYGDYYINNEDYSLIYKANIPIGTIVMLSFHGEFLDTRRSPNEVQMFDWSDSLTTEMEDPQNVTVTFDNCESKMSLSPFKNRGKFPIHAVVHNGPSCLSTDICSFTWQYAYPSDTDWKSVVADTGELPWYVSGADSETIIIDQDYLNKVRIRCAVAVKDLVGTHYSPVSLLRRWYGQYDEQFDFLSGKNVTVDTLRTMVKISVSNRQGIIGDVCQFFDVSIYYPDKYGILRCISHTTTATVEKADIQENDHNFGYAVRELSAMKAMALDNGKVLCDQAGRVLFAQFPTVTIDDN